MREWIRELLWEIGQWDWVAMALKFTGGAFVQLLKTLLNRRK